MSTVERATVTVNYFGGWGSTEDHSGMVSNVPQSQGKTDYLVEEMSRGVEQSGVSPKSQEDIQKRVISVAQEVAARHKEDAVSDAEVAAARLIVLAKMLSHQEGNAQMTTIRGRENLAQCLAGLVSSPKSNTVDSIKVAELVINSDYTKSLGRIEATLGRSLQTVNGSKQISDADKKAFAQAVYDSDAARGAGPETVTFLKNYLKNLARLQDHPDDLNAVSDAIFESYLVNFGDAAQGLSGVELENGIGLAMGLKPDQALGSGKASLFSGEQLKTIKTIANQIQNLGGKNAKISAMPVLLAPSDSKAGIQKFMLWRVTTAQNKEIYVDTLGQAHNSVNDFIEHNKLGFGRFVVVRDGRMTVNQNGKVDVQEFEKSAYSEQEAIKNAAKIRDALDKNDFIDWGTDEGAVYDVLKSRSAAEIDMIRKAYNKEYDDGHADFDKDLHDEFDDDKAELDRLNALLKGKYDTKSENEAKAAEIKAELDDFSVDEQSVLKMFERIPAPERQTVAETYARMYGKSQKGAAAIDYLLSQCRASFNDEEMARAKDLLKPDGGDFEAGAARNSAARLHIAVAGAGTDEDTVFEVLSGKDATQIKAIKTAYKEKYGESLEASLKDDLNDGEWAYAEKLMNPLAPDADETSKAKWKAELSAAHLYSAMDGAGTNKDIIKAELKGKSPQEMQAIIDAYDYGGKSLSQRLKEDLEGKAEEDEILHLLDVAKVKDQVSMDAWQIDDAAINLRLATSGLGDKDLIRQVLTGKSKIQIHGDANHEGIEQAYKRLYNRDLRADLKGQLDGRDWIEMRQIYDGGSIDLDSANPDSEMVAEFIHRQRELSEYERQGLSGKDAAMLANPVTSIYGAFKALGSDEVRGGLQKLTHWDSNYETDRERLDRNLGDAEKALKEYKETGDRKKLAEAARLAGFAENDVKTVAQNKDALTNAVVTGATVVVGTIATLPVGGWGGVALAAGASALTAGVGYTAMDSQIGAGEITRQTVIAGVAGGFGAPVRGASGAVTKAALTETTAVGKTVALRNVDEGAVKLTGRSAPQVVERGLLRTEAEAGAVRAGQPASLRSQLMTGTKMGAINNGAVALTDAATNPRLLHDPKSAILSVVTGVVSGAAMGVTFVGSALGLGRLFKATRQVRATAESEQPFANNVVPERLTPNRKAIEAGTIEGEVVNVSSSKPARQTMSLRLPDETGQTMEVTAQVMGRFGKKRMEEPLPDPVDILLPGARDTGQRWALVRDKEEYFVIRRIMGGSPDHPVSTGYRDDDLPWYLQPTNQFREWTARKIFSDQNHPLRFLLADRKRNPEIDPKIKEFRRPPSRRHDDLIGRSEDDISRPRTEQEIDHMPVYIQAGHLTSLSQLKAEAAAGLTPGEERFALQDAWLNQYDNIAGENAGVFMTRTAVDIGGIPVETRTAQMWEREGFLPPNTVANALSHMDWTAPGSSRGASSNRPVPEQASASPVRSEANTQDVASQADSSIPESGAAYLHLAKEAYPVYSRQLDNAMDTLRDIVGDLGAVTGRAKSPESAANRLQRSADNYDAKIDTVDDAVKNLYDAVGTRVTLVDASPGSVDQLVGRLADAIKSGQLKITRVNSLTGEGGIPYLTDAHLETLQRAAASVDKPLITTQKPYNTGYTIGAMYVEYPNGVKGEIQILGEEVSKVADAEHVVYDAFLNKPYAGGFGPNELPKAAAVLDPIRDAAQSLNPLQRKQYNSYLNSVYKNARSIESGQPSSSVPLPEGISGELGIDNLNRAVELIASLKKAR